MKSLLLTAALALVAACNRPAKTPDDARMSAQSTAETGLLDAVYEIRDKDSGKRVGLLKKRRYADSRIVYWVEDLEGERRGYILENNRAYAYDWHVGRRTEEARFIGADTISAGARRVLGYDQPVTLEATTLQALAAEYGPRTGETAPMGEGEGGGETEE